ncbi:MAG: tetratricopeptide repeat protein [Deltaproteobacteria bacterium]|nr:tetratricopeptide repeat protein [Deltaproteobacteria bacterium]
MSAARSSGLRRLLGGCVALLVALALAACSGEKKNVRGESQSAYKLGVAYLREGRTSMALQEFAKAEALTPDDPEVLNGLGLTYWARHEYALATAKLQKATALKPDDSRAWNSLGALYGEQGRYPEAVNAFENALKNVFYDTRELALANLGWALVKSGRVADGEKRLREAVDLNPSFAPARKNLGMVLQERGEYREAVTHLDVALQRSPDDAEVHLYRGLCLFKLGDREAARASFEKAWRLAPGAEAGKSAKNYLDLLQ